MSTARRAALLDWYDRERRDLPWRQSRDPYAILVSEVMAQQTQISRVIPHYERFLEQFPTVQHLAAAEPGDVLSAWSGLGYNRRATNLHRAARMIAADGWPVSVDDLQTLPGVGPYTASAVACFAFGVPVATVDTNVRRVLGRWLGRELSGRPLTEAAETELDPHRPGDWNQAVMDLGSAVCTPQKPDCGRCPVARWCIDPTVYTPPPKQGPFAGSMREARGAVIRTLVAQGRSAPVDIADRTGLSRQRIAAAVDALHREGMIERSGDAWRLARRPQTVDR